MNKKLAWAVLPLAALLAACGTPTPSSSNTGLSSSSSHSTGLSSSESTHQTGLSSSDSTSSSSSSQPQPIQHLTDYTKVAAVAEQRVFDERFDEMVDDFSGENISGTTDGVRHNGFFRGIVDSSLESFPKTTDGAIYKAAAGTYEAMNFGANGIGFKMRVARGSIKLANLRLELRGGDGFKTYPIQLSEARDGDNEALPEITGEFQEFVVNPGQSIEDENTKYINVDGTTSDTTVLSKILGFHLVANDVEVAAEIEIAEVFTYSGTNKVVLDDFNRTDIAQVPDAWWGGSACGFIVRKGVKLTGGKAYTTPSIADQTFITLTGIGDTTGTSLVGLDAEGNVLATVAWAQLTANEAKAVAFANGEYGNYIVELEQLAGNGVLDKVKVVSTTEIELAGVFLTSLAVPELDLIYPYIEQSSMLDTFNRNIASLNDNWDASAAIQGNIDEGVTGFVSYNHGDQIKTEGGKLILPAAEDYAQVTIGYQDQLVNKNAKYFVIVAKGDDLSLMRFKFRDQGSNKEVWFNAGLAAEGVKAYGNDIPSPYVDEDGFTHYVFDMALNGLAAGGIFDLYYTGATGAEIKALYFANDDFAAMEISKATPEITAARDLSGYSYVGGLHAGDFRYFGVKITAATGDANLMSFRITYNGAESWFKDGNLTAYTEDGNKVDPTAPIPAEGETIYLDLLSSGCPAEGDGWCHLHVGAEGYVGTATIEEIGVYDAAYSKSLAGSPAIEVNKEYKYLAGYDIDEKYDVIGVSVKATGTNMTYESFRIESPVGTFSFFNNPETVNVVRSDGSAVAASDAIPEEGEAVYVLIAESAIAPVAGSPLHFHYAGWGDPVGTIQLLGVQLIAEHTPYSVILGTLNA